MKIFNIIDMITFFLVGTLIGMLVVMYSRPSTIEAINHNAAEYNQTTGNWQWKTNAVVK